MFSILIDLSNLGKEYKYRGEIATADFFILFLECPVSTRIKEIQNSIFWILHYNFPNNLFNRGFTILFCLFCTNLTLYYLNFNTHWWPIARFQPIMGKQKKSHRKRLLSNYLAKQAAIVKGVNPALFSILIAAPHSIAMSNIYKDQWSLLLECLVKKFQFSLLSIGQTEIGTSIQNNDPFIIDKDALLNSIILDLDMNQMT